MTRSAAKSIVYGRDGKRLGSVAGEANGKKKLELHLDNGRRIFVAADTLTRRPRGGYKLDVSPDELAARRDGVRVEAGKQAVIPVVEERAVIRKQIRKKSEVTVHIIPRERRETVRIPLTEEHVDVQRVPVNQFVEGPVAIREEGNVTIIPVMEEVLVVEKRLMLREEVHVVRRKTTTEQQQEVTLRREEVEVLRSENSAE